MALLEKLGAAGMALFMASAPASAAGPNVVNIINFIRGTEPRANVNLLQPVVEQIRLAKQHGLPTTFLIQYDALVNPAFVDLLKSELGPEDEIGVWLEVVQPQVEAAGMVWRGRWPWDYNAAVGLTQAYTVQEREKLMDVLMERFKSEFGEYPRSAGCWVLDAPTLNYLHDRYGIVAACNCKDQSGTDGYTLWGGYWNQAYYPSRQNAFMPAQNAERQLNVPVFRMLGSDPVYQYDHSLGSGLQGVISLEPVYRPGGGSPDWVRWFFDVNFNAPNLAFAYTQAGQENSFGWPAMSAGLVDQYQLIADLRAQGKLRVETLEKSGEWFRDTFETTPATAVVAMDDFEAKGHRSVWYESRFYRVNFYWEGNTWRIRDLHVFNEKYAERYLRDRVTGGTCTYDTLPVVDGFHWSTSSDLAGFRALVNTQGGSRELLANGAPTVTEVGDDGLLIRMPVTSGGELRIHCNPANLEFEMTGASAPSDWGLELRWSPQRTTSIVTSGQRLIGYQHNNFGYALRTGDATVSVGSTASSLLVRPDGATVTFDFDAANATSYWDVNGAEAGAGSATPAGTWDAAAENWTASANGTEDTVAWPGAGHGAVFAAGGDATGNYTVTIDGERDADGVVVEEGNVTLSGGSLNLSTPAVLRAEEGAGLTIASRLVGSSGLLLEGDGTIHLSGEHPLSGPLGVTAGSLTLASGTRFEALSHVSLGSGASLAAEDVTLGLTGNISLTGAIFAGSGVTSVAARNFTMTVTSNPPVLSLSDTAAVRLASPSPAQSTFEQNGGSVTLADSSELTTDRWTNRGTGLSHTLEISGSSRLAITDDFVLGGHTGAAITVNQTGGTVTNTGTTNNPGGDDASNRWGLWGSGANVAYHITGGSLNLIGAPLYLSWDSGAELNIGGTAAVNLKGVNFGWNARAQAAAIRLAGGTLNIGSAGLVAGGGANKSFVLSGGTLGASADWSSSLRVDVTGEARVSNSGGDIAFAGGMGGTGTLTKQGAGTLALAGPLSFTGTVDAREGTLRVGSPSAMAVNVAGAAVIAAGDAYGQGTGSVSTLNLASGSASTFRIGGGDNSLTVTSPDGLVTGGNHVVHITVAAGATPGTYPLFRYHGSIGGSGASAFSLGSAPGVEASIVNHPETSSVDLVIESVDDTGTGGPFIQELFDAIVGTPPGISGTLNGKGNTATTVGLSGVWVTNGSNGIFAASNFDIASGLPGLPPTGGATGGLTNNTASWNTNIYATRPLAAAIDFSVSRTLYFSFRADNRGDSSMGIGLAAGAGGAAEFIGAGLTWNNARSIATGEIDAGNSAFISYGNLNAGSGPYGVRAHGPQGAINGPALIVGRLTIDAAGPDRIDIKQYAPGDLIDSDPAAVAWTASDSVSSSMTATHLLVWLNGASSNSAGEVDAIRFGNTWSEVTGATDAYQSWVSGPPYFLAGADALPGADPDGDGISNAIEFIIGGNPRLAGDADRLPVVEVTEDAFEIRYSRTTRSNLSPFPFIEYSADLAGWTPALDGADGVVVTAAGDPHEAGVERVRVRIPRSLAEGSKLFARLNANR